jgi:hypothetical protein
MGMHFRFPTTLAVVGMLAAGAASAARAQDTSSAARTDTMGYQPSSGQTDTAQAGNAGSQADTGNFKYTGPPTDTTLKAEPGVQTGPTAGDSATPSARAGAAGQADTVVCKDGSNAGRKVGCEAHGGIDWAATKAALNARGGGAARQTADSGAVPADTTKMNEESAGDYQQDGAPSDTVLKAAPGTQTGADTGAAKADTGAYR